MGNYIAESLNTLNETNKMPYPSFPEAMGILGMYTGTVSTGSFTGTGAALDVTLAFNPVAVMIINPTNAQALIQTKSMTAKASFKIAAAIAMATEGITLGVNKFSVSTDNTNGNGNTIHYIAIGQG